VISLFQISDITNSVHQIIELVISLIRISDMYNSK